MKNEEIEQIILELKEMNRHYSEWRLENWGYTKLQFLGLDYWARWNSNHTLNLFVPSFNMHLTNLSNAQFNTTLKSIQNMRSFL